MVQLTDLIITSTFTGIGTATGLALFELFLKEKIHHIGKKLKEHVPIYRFKPKDKEMLNVSSSIPS